MANKVTSAPLFGSATPQDIEAIKSHMTKFADRTAKNGPRARALLETIGAIEAEPPAAAEAPTEHPPSAVPSRQKRRG